MPSIKVKIRKLFLKSKRKKEVKEERELQEGIREVSRQMRAVKRKMEKRDPRIMDENDI